MYLLTFRKREQTLEVVPIPYLLRFGPLGSFGTAMLQEYKFVCLLCSGSYQDPIIRDDAHHAL
jgi:hypothetical protein